jgi:hypothetical protein
MLLTAEDTICMADTNRFLRNKGLINQSKLDELMIIGLGGIGSSVVTYASIMGFDKLLGYDYDTLEEHNLSTCVYEHKYLGMSKAEAASHTVESFQGNADFEDNAFIMGKEMSTKVIMCPDNMGTRKDIYKQWSMNPNREFLIDLRMGALAMEIITVTPENDEFMNSWLPDHKMTEEECTMKHTIFTSAIVAGLGLSQVFNLLERKPYYSYIWVGLLPLSVKKEGLKIPSEHKLTIGVIPDGNQSTEGIYGLE